jgi:hypothetical protein
MIIWGGKASYLYSTEYNDLVIQKNIQEAKGPFGLIMKHQQTFSNLGLPSGTSVILFLEGLQHSVASVSQSSHQPVPPLGDELLNLETVFWTQRLEILWLMSVE